MNPQKDSKKAQKGFFSTSQQEKHKPVADRAATLNERSYMYDHTHSSSLNLKVKAIVHIFLLQTLPSR